MTTRPSIPRRVKGKQIVLPNAPKEEEIKLGTASSWNRSHLKILGVDFPLKQRIDLNRILKVKEAEWSQELRESTTPRHKSAHSYQESPKVLDNYRQ
jgi:hypothetical protein